MRLLVLAATVSAHALLTSFAFSQQIDFNRDIRPILSNRCLACHGPDDAHREASLRLDDETIATKVLESGRAAIVAGNPEESEMLARITSSDESTRMPPAHFGKPLSEAETAKIRLWISQGANLLVIGRM